MLYACTGCAANRSIDPDNGVPVGGWGSRREALIDSRFSTIICAPVYSTRHGLATQVDVGLNEGLRHDSSVHCDELVSLRKSQLTQFVGTFDTTKLKCLDDALMVALGLLRS